MLSINGDRLAKYMKEHFKGKRLFVRFERIEKITKKKAFLDQIIDINGWFVS